MKPLDILADRLGLALTHHDIAGNRMAITEETKLGILASMGIDTGSEEAIAAALERTAHVQAPVLRAPPDAVCFVPDFLNEARAWGIFLQLYELRSARNWGIGDFADLAQMARIAAEAGADFLGTNPLHALFIAQPQRRSPFSPSNRRFLNPLYIAVDQFPGWRAGPEDMAVIDRLRDSDLIDYEAVSGIKLRALRQLHEAWRENEEQSEGYSRRQFETFCTQGGQALRRHALFEALSLHFAAEGNGGGWREWPEAFHDVQGGAVARFAQAHEEEIGFHSWLQWIARKQLADAAMAAREAGMRIGLYLDLAVGEAPDGSATWSDPGLAVSGVTIGAPPDFFTAAGQDWGLAPLSPLALAERRFEPFKSMLEASMREAGALRIDHVMALWQLFFVPGGGKPADGAYMRYPVEDMLRALAQASQQWRTMVIGEDLGNVPDGFREVMDAARILSYRILYFEQDDQGFLAPGRYPRSALACLSTHDLPTLAAWWRGDDIGLRREHELIEADAAEAQAADRTEKRFALVRALARTRVVETADLAVLESAARQGDQKGIPPSALLTASYRYIARTPCMLAGVRLADLAGELRPTNLPGTVDSYPNWRPRVPVAIEEIAATADFRAVTQAMRQERPRQP